MRVRLHSGLLSMNHTKTSPNVCNAVCRPQLRCSIYASSRFANQMTRRIQETTMADCQADEPAKRRVSVHQRAKESVAHESWHSERALPHLAVRSLWRECCDARADWKAPAAMKRPSSVAASVVGAPSSPKGLITSSQCAYTKLKATTTQQLKVLFLGSCTVWYGHAARVTSCPSMQLVRAVQC